ncbi:hypothetical protein ACFQL7_03685 [Halocatena marina]|uniref:Uncharacterized protein n=1 Tax=Halocatena marina TaxID=2934937 RepID=A0ABD5YN14_9EURY
MIAYDAVFPAQTGDKKLTSFLDGKTTEFSGLTPKTSVTEIRSNIETGLVQEVLPAIKRAQIRGNFGSHQTTLAVSAVVQDDPNGYTGDAIDFLFKEGGLKHTGDDSSWGRGESREAMSCRRFSGCSTGMGSHSRGVSTTIAS